MDGSPFSHVHLHIWRAALGFAWDEPKARANLRGKGACFECWRVRF